MEDKNAPLKGVPDSGQVGCEANPPRRILIVDDDADIRRLNTAVLTHSGYHVEVAEDGAAAWDTLQLNSYDLLITDNNMPKISGIELLKKLHAGRVALPVIMATGTLPAEEFTRHPWIRPAAILLKPFTVAQLLGAVEKVLCVAGGPHELAGSRQPGEGRCRSMADGGNV